MGNLLDIDNEKQPPINPETSPITTPTLQKQNSCGPKFLDKDKIKKYRMQGLKCQEIADIMKCAKSSIVRALYNIEFTNEELEEARKLLPQFKLNDYLKYRSYITPDKLKKADAGTLAKMVSFKYNEYCLETGKTTVNVGLTANDLTNQRQVEQEQEANDLRRVAITKLLADSPEFLVDNQE